MAPLLRQASGVDGQISNAMKHGVPVVATHVAIEGMHLLDGADVLVGGSGSPVLFADQLVQLYTNCMLWDRITTGGFSNLRRNYSPQTAKLQLLSSFSEAGLPPQGVGEKHHCHTA